MTIILSLLGGLFSRMVNLLQLALVHWRIVLPIVIFCFMWWQNFNLQLDLRNAQVAHYMYMAEVSLDAAERQATLKEQERQVDIYMDETNAAHAVIISNLKDYYNAKIKADSVSHASSADGLRSQLRIALDAQAYAARRPADPAGSAEGFAGSGGDSDPAGVGQRYQALQRQYDILELSCAITTQDYNTLASRSRRLCQIYPCKGILRD